MIDPESLYLTKHILQKQEEKLQNQKMEGDPTHEDNFEVQDDKTKAAL